MAADPPGDVIIAEAVAHRSVTGWLDLAHRCVTVCVLSIGFWYNSRSTAKPLGCEVAWRKPTLRRGREKDPLATHLEVRFVHAPRIAHRRGVPLPAFLKIRDVPEGSARSSQTVLGGVLFLLEAGRSVAFTCSSTVPRVYSLARRPGGRPAFSKGGCMPHDGGGQTCTQSRSGDAGPQPRCDALPYCIGCA